MNITWYGQTCFRINSRKNKNGQLSILIDPFTKEIGLRAPKLEADILLFTDPNAPLFLFKKEAKSEEIISAFPITGPGEYDVKGVYIEGILAQDRTIYTIESEEIKICHLGKLSQKELTPSQLERIGDIDVLMIPIGGGETINPEEAIKIMAQIEPKITIPMYYQIPKLKIKLESLTKFLKSLGISSLPPIAKLSLKKKDVPKDEAKIIVLQP